MYEIFYYKNAVDFLNKNKDIKQKIKSKISALKDWPVNSKNIIAMSGGYKGYYRLKIGKTRTIFYVDSPAKKIFIESIGYRGDIYK